MSEPTLFEAAIVPHRSLGARGLGVLTGSLVAAMLLALGLALRLRAWPVGGFAGGELLLAILLLRWHRRRDRSHELVLLTPSALQIQRTGPDGVRRDVTLPAAWLNAWLEDRPGRAPAVVVGSHGRHEEVGALLGEAERRDLAAALAAALHRMRHPDFDNPILRPEAELSQPPGGR